MQNIDSPEKSEHYEYREQFEALNLLEIFFFQKNGKL